MWATGFCKTRLAPRLRFHVDAAVAQRGLSRLAIWNYNEPNQLDKGVRNIRVFRQDRLVYEGVLEKGRRFRDGSLTRNGVNTSLRPFPLTFLYLHTCLHTSIYFIDSLPLGTGNHIMDYANNIPVTIQGDGRRGSEEFTRSATRCGCNSKNYLACSCSSALVTSV